MLALQKKDLLKRLPIKSCVQPGVTHMLDDMFYRSTSLVCKGRFFLNINNGGHRLSESKGSLGEKKKRGNKNYDLSDKAV